MNLIDMFFENIKNVDDPDNIPTCEFWSCDYEGNYLLGKTTFDSNMFEDRTIITNSPKRELFCNLETNFNGNLPIFIPYEEIEFMSKIEVEIKGKILYDYCQKNPLVCVRGMCSKPCNIKTDIKPYCFREIPCTNHRPDWNCWSISDPSFGDFLFSVVDFVINCPNTNTLIVMFDFTPNSYECELNFKYATAVLVKDIKITFLNDADEIKNLYEEYNAKYPTEESMVLREIGYY